MFTLLAALLLAATTAFAQDWTSVSLTDDGNGGKILNVSNISDGYPHYKAEIPNGVETFTFRIAKSPQTTNKVSSPTILLKAPEGNILKMTGSISYIKGGTSYPMSRINSESDEELKNGTKLWSNDPSNKSYKQSYSINVQTTTNLLSFAVGLEQNGCNFEATVEIVPLKPLNLTVNTASHGKVTANKTKPSEYAKITLNAEPDNGYVLQSVSVTDNDGSISVSAPNATWGDTRYYTNSPTFNMRTSDATVTPVFMATSDFLVKIPGTTNKTFNIPDGTTSFKVRHTTFNEHTGLSYSDESNRVYYTNNYDGTLLLTAATGIKLTVSGKGYFNDNGDYLEIYDGSTTSDTKLGSFTGQYLGGKSTNISANSTANNLLLRFVTNNSGFWKGLDLKITVVDNRKDISTLTTTVAAQTYAGSALTPVATIKDGSKTLTSGTDYTITLPDGGCTNAGNYTITITGKGNYTGTVHKTFTISPKAATVTATNKSKTYGDADPELTATVSGLVGSDKVAYIINRAEGANVGEYAITPSGRQNQDNYVVTFVAGKMTINAKTVKVTAANKTKTYGEADPELTATVEGLIGTDEVAYTISRTEGANVGEYAITPAGKATQGNYAVTYVAGKMTIKAKAVKVTANNKTKTYGDAEPELTATVEGLVGNDAVSYIVYRDAGQNVGEYIITPAGKQNQGNYTVTFVAGKMTINPKAVKVTADNKTKTYGAADPELTATVEGLVGKDKVNYTVSREEGANVGVYAITASGEAKQGNYTVTYAKGKMTINAKSLTDCTISDIEAQTYTGSPLRPNATLMDGNTPLEVGRDFMVKMPEGGCINAGDYTISATGNGNYTGTVSKTFTILPKDVTVTAADKSKTYGEADPELTASVEGLIGTDEVVYTISRAVGTDAGEYAITPAGKAKQGNYAVTYVAGKMTINVKAVKVTAADKSKTYGEADPELTASVEGLVGTDEIAYTISRAEGANVGVYTITPAGKANQGNYAVSYATGTLTINVKAVKVTAADKTKTYGEADPELTANVEGLVGTDEIAYTISRAEGTNVGEYAITASGEAKQGNYTVTYAKGKMTINAKSLTDCTISDIEAQTYTGTELTPVATITDGSTTLVIKKDFSAKVPHGGCINAGDYTITATGRGNYTGTVTKTFTILPKAVTVTAADKSKTYGEDDPELTASVEGLIGTDEVVYTISRAVGTDAGEYAITPAGEAAQGNYAVTYVAGKFSIGKATTTFTDIESQTITCKQTLADVNLPAGYSFADAEQKLEDGENTVALVYNPDVKNYETASGSMTVTVEHSFVNYIYNNDATTEADGTETATCEHGCGATDTRTAEGTKLPDAVTAVRSIETEKQHAKKYLENGMVIIEVDGVKYDVTGRVVKY